MNTADAATLDKLADREPEWLQQAHDHYDKALVAQRATDPGFGPDYAAWSMQERALARSVRLLWIEMVRRGLAEDFDA